MTGGARSRQKRRPQADNRTPRSPKRSEGGDRREAGGRRAGNWGPARSGARGNGAPREDAGAKRRRWWPKAANRSRLQGNFSAGAEFRVLGNPKTQGRSPQRAWGQHAKAQRNRRSTPSPYALPQCGSERPRTKRGRGHRPPPRAFHLARGRVKRSRERTQGLQPLPLSTSLFRGERVAKGASEASAQARERSRRRRATAPRSLVATETSSGETATAEAADEGTEPRARSAATRPKEPPE